MERILLAAVIISLVAMFMISYGEYKPVEHHRVPAMLQICGSELWEFKDDVTSQPFWDDLVIEIRDMYPGYCLSGVKYSRIEGGYRVEYIVKSPDRKTARTNVMNFRNTFLTSN